MILRAALAEAQDLAAISRTYRLLLGSRAALHSLRGHAEMAEFLFGGAEAASELAAAYAEAALFLAAVRTTEAA